MKPEEFEQAVLAGEITDFEPYFEGKNNIKKDLQNQPYRLILLKHGIDAERILELDGIFAIVTCIQEGMFPERYKEWKDMDKEWILETFAENGYYLDELIESEYDDVREIVIENHPDFCIERLNQGKIYQIVHDYIINEAKPNIALFKAYIDTLKSNNNDIGLITKYRAITEVPATIEKTMSDVQLFEADSPFWATDLTVAQIHDVLEAKDIPFKVIEKYFETKDDDDDDTELELKYQAMKMTPTTIEKTMTSMQLFEAKNPLWALNLTGNQINHILNGATGYLKL